MCMCSSCLALAWLGMVQVPLSVSASELQHLVQLIRELRLDGIVVADSSACAEGDAQTRATLGEVTALVSALHTLAGGSLPIVAVGGAVDGESAFGLISAGASLVQVTPCHLSVGPATATR